MGLTKLTFPHKCAPRASNKRQQFRLELVLGDAGTDDLVSHFAVLEEQEQRDGTHVVFHGEIAGVIHVHLANLRLAIEIGGDLIEDRADHFAWTTPFSPEIHEDGHVGIDYFGLEIRVGKCQSHARTMHRHGWKVKNRLRGLRGGSGRSESGIFLSTDRESASHESQIEDAEGKQDVDDGPSHGSEWVEGGLFEELHPIAGLGIGGDVFDADPDIGDHQL